MGLFDRKKKVEEVVEEKQTQKKETKKTLIYVKNAASQTIHDPSGKTSRRANKSFTSYTREDIEGYLESPTSNEGNLREASVHLYQTNGRYRSLLQYYANLPCWVYVISALNYNPDKAKKDSFKKQYLKVCNILESAAVIKTMREITLTALREGVFYGAIWGGDGNSFIIQKLNPDNCVITSLTDGGVYQFAYDMSKVKETDLDTHYPPAFKDMWQAYKSTKNQYQMLPPEISVCVKADTTIPEYSIPPFSGILPELYTIKNEESLSENSSALSNYKLLGATIPVDDEGVPVIDYDTAMQYYQHIANNVGDRVGVAISPFKLESFNFEQSGSLAQVDNVSRAIQNFFSSAGTTASLHGATANTSGVVKQAAKIDESYAFGYMYQCGQIINRFLKTLSGTQKFKVTFLPVSIFNREEMLGKYKEAMNYGMGKLEYLATLGIPQHDIANLNFIENDILDINNLFVPPKTASTQSSDTSNSGRPLSDETDLDAAGDATRDADANDNR